MRLALGVLVALAGCGDPALRPVRKALAEWDDGKAALEAGDLELALRHFRAAREHDPNSPALAGWEARALASLDRGPEALAILDDALARAPDHVELRLQRAALRARRGDGRAAATDLQPLVAAGLLHPEDVAAEPDFAVLAADRETAWLVPPPRVDVSLQGEAGTVLVGETWNLVAELDAPNDSPVVVSQVGEGTTLLRLEKVVEDQIPGDARRRRARVTWTWRAAVPGEDRAGPWRFAAGRAEATVGPARVAVAALGQRTVSGEPWAPPTLALPADLASRPSTKPQRVGDLAVVAAPPGAEVTLTSAPTRGVFLAELRIDGQTRWAGPVVPAGSGALVRVVASGETVYDGPLP